MIAFIAFHGMPSTKESTGPFRAGFGISMFPRFCKARDWDIAVFLTKKLAGLGWTGAGYLYSIQVSAWTGTRNHILGGASLAGNGISTVLRDGTIVPKPA